MIGCAALLFPWINLVHRIERIKPTTNEPVSPIKILAGFILKNKKPRILPASANAMIAKLLSFPIVRKIPIVMRLIKPIPAARPSIPSMKLNAFIIPTMARIVKLYWAVIGSSFRPNSPPNVLIRMPDKAIKHASAISTRNLYFGERSFRSSVIPIAESTAIEKKQVIISPENEKGNQRAIDNVIPTMIAMPPNVGVGSECSFRESGMSCKLYLFTNLIIGGIQTIAITKAEMKESKPNL